MKPQDYLKAILKNQTLADDGRELKELRATRDEVEKLLRDSFEEASPSIRYGGSYAKGTMIREGYDLDITCYFPHDDTSVGDSLEEIYNNVRKALSENYYVEGKTSALRIKGKSGEVQQVDFHVDVVPGRFIDEKKKDVFLYQAHSEKKWLKTNLDKHIKFIRDSGFTDIIKLAKLWKSRKAMRAKTFVLELLVIKILSESKDATTLDEQLLTFWETLKEEKGQISVEDPANPSGNDLSDIFTSADQAELYERAYSTLNLIDSSGWESVFGEIEEPSEEEKIAIITEASRNGTRRTKPWCNNL